jgi:4-diphosphocytidyl-2-C-methyl-D-erythritol kinase
MEIIKCHAKINLFLEIINKDIKTGYHTLQTLMVQVREAYDVMKIEASNQFKVSSFGKYEVKGENILEKTVRIFKNEFGERVRTSFDVSLEKNIPIGGGMGGGSSDACAFLKFLLKENNIILKGDEFSSIAMKIGADVAFFIDSKPKICSGYGEVLNPISFNIPSQITALIIIPDFSLSTQDVFKKFTKEDYIESPNPLKDWKDVLGRKNDMEKYASVIEPEIKLILEDLSKLPFCIKAMMSGSGSVCFGLFENFAEAEKASLYLRKNGKYKEIIPSLLML